jgi:hypothetical protein
MKGVYKKQAIRGIVDPLKTLSSVFHPNPLRVVLETEEDGIYISTVDSNQSVFAMYKLNAPEVIEGYEPLGDLPIWDVKQFMNIVGNYEDDIYAENLEISQAENSNGKLIFKCGQDESQFNLAQDHLLEPYRFGKRNLDTSKMTKAVGFKLEDVGLKKVLRNMGVFVDQDRFIIEGVKGNDYVKMIIASSSNANKNKNESRIEGVNVEEDFSMTFNKAEVKGMFSSHDSINIGVYVLGDRQILEAGYLESGYELNCYFNPIDLDD